MDDEEGFKQLNDEETVTPRLVPNKNKCSEPKTNTHGMHQA